ncbi:MAG: hypothetical protein KKD39_08805, partial [Candidatus Altiarchaeota archaeon]|nr:hypothetical protein [Candidatus Altiarchaeota archaeon]
ICMNFSRYSDVCIRRNAIRSLDFSICNLYPADSVKEIGCNYETCMKSMDDNPGFECCKFIPYAAGSGQWYKNSCYIRRAGIDKDLKWCKYMVSADATVGLYDECYKAVAESKEDIGICSMVEKADVRDDCLLGLATEKTDCDTITNQEKKGGCQKKIV